MSDKKDKSEKLDGVMFESCPAGHVHPLGRFEGVLHREGADQGEVVYESKGATVGGGSKAYNDGYDRIDWN